MRVLKPMEALSRSIETLRSIDSLIDLSRATAQLKILLAIGKSSLTINEIVNYSKLKRKTVLDALRKLESKDLVTKNSGRYTLTQHGMKIYEALLRLASANYDNNTPVPFNLPFKRTLFLEAYDELLSALYFLRTLEIIGTSNRPYSLKKLAKKLGVSQITLDNHLRRFTTPTLPLLKRVYSLELKHVYYKLTELGLRFYATVFPKKSKRRFDNISLVVVLLLCIIILLLIL